MAVNRVGTAAMNERSGPELRTGPLDGGDLQDGAAPRDGTGSGGGAGPRGGGRDRGDSPRDGERSSGSNPSGGGGRPVGGNPPGAASGTGLPASLEEVWGLRQRPPKGPKPSLSLQRIVAAAVQVAAAEGLGALSMSRVASALGTSTMALYRYVAAKDELIELMLDAAFGPPPPAEPGEGWRDGLSRWARAALDALRRHRWAVHAPISRPPVTPNQIAWLERGLVCLAGTRLSGQEKMSTILLVSGFVWRWATLESDLAAALQAAGAAADPSASYGRMLARLIDPERFPELSAVLATGALDDDPDDFGADFVFGLERILDGIEVLVRSRATD
jgi:AcrR family transcriptional regulator